MEYCWFLKLPDNSEHKFYYGPEEQNPLENVSGFKQGSQYMVQAPTLQGNPYAVPVESGSPPEWASGAEDCYFIEQVDVINVSGFAAFP